MGEERGSFLKVLSLGIIERLQKRKDTSTAMSLATVPTLISGRFHLQCRKCETHFPIDDEGIWKQRIKDWLAGAETIPPTTQISALKCERCPGIVTCAGCGEEPRIGGDNYWTSLGVVNHCCEGGRLFGISVFLSQVDYVVSLQDSKHDMKKHEKKTAREKLISHLEKAKSIVGKQPKAYYEQPGVGYASLSDDGLLDALDTGTSLSDDGMYDHDWYALSRLSEAAQAASRVHVKDPLDDTLAQALMLLVGFLPQSSPPDDAIEFLSSGRFLDKLNGLARNDSIEDMTQRPNVYAPLFRFVYHILKDGSGLAELVFQERRGEPSMFASFRNSYEQAGTYLALTSKSTAKAETIHEAPAIRVDGRLLMSDPLYRPRTKKDRNIVEEDPSHEASQLCKILIDLYQKMAHHEANKSEMDVEEEHDVWHEFWRENKFTFSDEVSSNHRLLQKFPFTNTSARNRLNTISKQLSTLHTSLPEGVFVKVDESRSDVMKVLMVGVEGTPYEGGLFTFDLLLKPNFPITPPQMSFVLENVDEDQSPINPNLHVGGQVCLSLLNTWDGAPSEMWQPNKSTLLAVLVSVHSMILGAPIPYMNEPGAASLHQAGHKGKSEVLAYTHYVQCKTVKYAMIQWLRDLEKLETDKSPSNLWKETSAAYWKHNGEKVLQTVKQWAKGNLRLTNYYPELAYSPFGDNDNVVGKRKSKGKKKATEGENLLHTLTQLISPSDAESVAQAQGIPVHKRESHSAEDDSESASSTKRQKLNGNQLPEVEVLTWRYMGAVNKTDIHAACKDFGVKPSNSNLKSIAKLQDAINQRLVKVDEDYFEAIDRWGILEEEDTFAMNVKGST